MVDYIVSLTDFQNVEMKMMRKLEYKVLKQLILNYENSSLQKELSKIIKDVESK